MPVRTARASQAHTHTNIRTLYSHAQPPKAIAQLKHSANVHVRNMKKKKNKANK